MPPLRATSSWSVDEPLRERGSELGKIDDVVFDPVTGNLDLLVVGDREHPASALPGSGSYAAVLAEAVTLKTLCLT
jgi:sporulation protein YlmC with PRC-barrel domain